MHHLRCLLLTVSLLAVGACAPDAEPLRSSIAVSSDGNTIVFGIGDRERPLTVCDRKLRTSRTVGPAGYYSSVALSADEESVICSFSADQETWRIASVDVSDGQISILTKGNDFSPTVVSKDTILFWRSLGRSGDLFGGTNPADFEIFALDLTDLRVRQLTRGSFFQVSAIVHYKGIAIFSESDKVLQLDLASGAVTPQLSDTTFRPLVATGDGTIIGNVMKTDPYLVLPAALSDNSVVTLARISQVRSAAYSPETNTLFFGCILPWSIYSFDRKSGSLTREPIELK